MRTKKIRHLGVATAGLTAATLLAACGSSTTTDTRAAKTPAAQGASTPAEREVPHLAPRALITHEGGVSLIDTETGAVVNETPIEGFLRLAEAGDGRHAVITDATGFRVYDAGIRVEGHGDHTHAYESDARLTAVTYPGEKAGHVTVHDRLTTLFADGAGEIQVVESGRIADPAGPVRRYSTDQAHHGVAFELATGELVTTQGDSESRTTVEVIGEDGVLASTDTCAGVHGMAIAAPTVKGEVIVFGCENGPVVLRSGAFRQLNVPDDYARTGNLAGHPDSPVVLSDYKVDPDADLERPTRVALIDTRKDDVRLVELNSSYWFRSLGRGPNGEALVLTYDGTLRVIDPVSGRQQAAIEVIAPWREHEDWQQPGPILSVADDHAYVTDAATGELVVVDLETRKVEGRLDLPHPAGELAVLTGVPAWEAHEH